MSQTLCFSHRGAGDQRGPQLRSNGNPFPSAHNETSEIYNHPFTKQPHILQSTHDVTRRPGGEEVCKRPSSVPQTQTSSCHVSRYILYIYKLEPDDTGVLILFIASQHNCHFGQIVLSKLKSADSLGFICCILSQSVGFTLHNHYPPTSSISLRHF